MDPLKKLSQVRGLPQKQKDAELIHYLYSIYDNDKPSKFIKKYKKILKEISVGGCEIYVAQNTCNCSEKSLIYPECTNYFNIDVFNYALSLNNSVPLQSGSWSYMGSKNYEKVLHEIYNEEYNTTDCIETLYDKSGNGHTSFIDRAYTNGKAYYYNNSDNNDIMKEIIVNNLNKLNTDELLQIVKIATRNDPKVYNALIN